MTIEQALRTARDTKVLRMGRGALGEAAEVLRAQFGNARAVVVADRETFEAAGRRVAEALGAEVFVFEDPALYAEYRFVEELERGLKGRDAVPVAVGAGTINDLTKLVAHRLGKQYLCVATAASMDGYTAYGSSITHQGSKQTFDCPAPLAVVADLDVIERAPRELTAAGYGDLLAKLTAGADWIVADALGVERIEPLAWAMVQARLRQWAAVPLSVGHLLEGLMMTGLAMQSFLSSRPASGAEHQFSHLWDMQHHTHQGATPSHGFKVAVATVAVARLYESLMQMPLEKLDLEKAVAAWPTREEMNRAIVGMFPDPQVREVALRESGAKHVSRDELRGRLQRLREVWPELVRRLRAQLPAPGELEQWLRAVGAPVEPEEIGISRARLRASFRLAYHIRRRFTVLDLAVTANVLDEAIA